MDGACAPVESEELQLDLAKLEGNFIKPPYGQGGDYEGMAPFKAK